MNEQDRRALRRQLPDLRRELEEIEATSKESARPVTLDQQGVGRLSRVDAIAMRQIAAESKRRRKGCLKRIRSALPRPDAEEYGYCPECGEKIDIRRLRVDPAHTLRIDCASRKR